MDILKNMFFFIIGAATYLIFVLQILITLFCAIPMTRRFSQAIHYCKNGTNSLYLRSFLTILFNSIAILAIVLGVKAMSGLNGFVFGLIVLNFFSAKSTGITLSNTNDYFRTYIKPLSSADLEYLQTEYAYKEKSQSPLFSVISSLLHIISFFFALSGIIALFYDNETLLVVAAIFSLFNSVLNATFGEQDDLSSETLFLTLGFFVSLFVSASSIYCISLSLCIAEVLITVISYFLGRIISR